MSIQIINADVFDALASLPAESVHCVVTSPPYWGLRDYGHDGQIGHEPTMQEHIAVMVRVFRELRRVLRADGTCWLNYGDCYAGSSNQGGTNSKQGSAKRVGAMSAVKRDIPDGTKPKDLCMIPARLAIALQDDGWWVRSEIIWAKPNPMPESVTDRPTNAHEKVFLLTKSARYFYDADAVKTESDESYLQSSYNPPGGNAQIGKMYQTGKHSTDKQRGHGRRHAGFNDRWDAMSKEEQQQGANLRNVWTIATKPYSEAHFATFPPELPELCIKAGCPEGGTVLDPFGGAGTTGLVADRLQREAILIEINPEYAAMARARIERDAPMFTEVHIAG